MGPKAEKMYKILYEGMGKCYGTDEVMAESEDEARKKFERNEYSVSFVKILSERPCNTNDFDKYF